ncbi:MAG: hypothetical protein MJA31_02510 [Clostridia bacterium]|nr:hypothetical protein [Clostridia bacterium]
MSDDEINDLPESNRELDEETKSYLQELLDNRSEINNLPPISVDDFEKDLLQVEEELVNEKKSNYMTEKFDNLKKSFVDRVEDSSSHKRR